MRSTHRLNWARTAALAALGTLGATLAACGKDAPTAATPSPPVHASTIDILPDAGHAAALAVNRGYKLWPTISHRTSMTTNASLRPYDRVSAQVNSPFDLNEHTDTVITGGINFNIYVNCNSALACWGSNGLTPGMFLKDLNNSRFLNIANQYMFGKNVARQFGFDSISASDAAIINNGNVATFNNIYSILFQVATQTGEFGLNTVYHVFLPQGTDMCQSAHVCYSPDSAQNFVFCAFHGAVEFNGTMLVIYSVEPYQAVSGCQSSLGTPHGVIDATASTLSHEFFESITDPLLNAWFNEQTGEEVGDLCAAFENSLPIGLHYYQIQSEYSNAIHNCTNDPFK